MKYSLGIWEKYIYIFLAVDPGHQQFGALLPSQKKRISQVKINYFQTIVLHGAGS